jgi:hypothetical protein
MNYLEIEAAWDAYDARVLEKRRELHQADTGEPMSTLEPPPKLTLYCQNEED